MATGKAREKSVMTAKRQAAVAQIAEQLRGAFGDYVRSQMAAQPQAAPPPMPPVQQPPAVGAIPMPAPPLPPAPGLPPQPVTFEDGSTALMGGGVDPGFPAPPVQNRVLPPVMNIPPELLAYIEQVRRAQGMADVMPIPVQTPQMPIFGITQRGQL